MGVSQCSQCCGTRRGALCQEVPKRGKQHRFRVLPDDGWFSYNFLAFDENVSEETAWLILEHSGDLEADAGTVALVVGGSGPSVEVRVGALSLGRTDASKRKWAGACGAGGIAWEASRSAEALQDGETVARLRMASAGLLVAANHLSEEGTSAGHTATTKELELAMEFRGETAPVEVDLDDGNDAQEEEEDDEEEVEKISEVTYRVSKPTMEIIWRCDRRKLSDQIYISASSDADPLLACAMCFVLARWTRRSAESLSCLKANDDDFWS